MMGGQPKGRTGLTYSLGILPTRFGFSYCWPYPQDSGELIELEKCVK